MHRKLIIPAFVALSALLAGCEKTLDTSSLEPSVKKVVEQNGGPRVKSVECPSDVKVKKGTKFDCEVTLRNGKTAQAKVVVTGDQGEVRFQANNLEFE